MDALAREIAELIYNQKKIPKDVFEKQMATYASKLMEGIFLGYDCNFSKENISPLQATTLRELERNAWIFSGFKSSKYINELTHTRKALTKDGKIVPFEEFKKTVLTIDKTYNQTYLLAEYNHAIGASRAVAQWEQFQAEKHIFPNLQWDAVLDDRTRIPHAALDGVIKPIDDPFWSTHPTPLDWNCRCERRQTNAPATPGIPQAVKDMKIKDYFRTNPGETKQIFNDKHPYFGCYPDIAISMGVDDCKRAKKLIESIADSNITYQAILDDIKENRKALKIWARENLIGRTHNTSNNISIEYSGRSIDHVLGHYHPKEIEKNLMLVDIENILKKSKYLGQAPDTIKDPQVKQWHYYQYREDFYINVKEFIDGRSILYSIGHQIKRGLKK